MAGTKISELPAATLPLTGSELVPVVQGGATTQTTLVNMPYVPTGTGAVTTTVQAKLRETVSVKDFGAVGDGVADDTAAVENAINAANGKQLFFPAGTYLITRQLVLTVWKYSLVGERNERGANGVGANSSYHTSKIVYQTSTPNTPMIARSDTSAPFASVIGPFEHTNLAFLVGNANLCKFGSVIPVSDSAGEKYIFGVRFNGCAIHAQAVNRASNAAGQITRSGQILVELIKCFESEILDSSLYGSDIQVKTTGCDKPVIRGLRSQGSHIPISFNGSGSFTVQHTVDDFQVENWTFAPIQNNGVSLAATNIRLEQNDGTPVGSGRCNLTTLYGYTANVTAGSGSIVFSADMTGILFANDSVIEITDGVNIDSFVVESVSNNVITVSTSTNILTWSNSAATVIRIHGTGIKHQSAYESAISNIHCGNSLTCPSFVYVIGRGNMSVNNANQQAGTNNTNGALIIGNINAGTFYMGAQLSFSNCSPQVTGDPSHPFVNVDNWRPSYGEIKTGLGSDRPLGGDAFETLKTARRGWFYDAKRSSTVSSNSYLNPIKKIPGDANTAQKPWVWYVASALRIFDETLPSTAQGSLRFIIRAASFSATDTLSITAQGFGGGNLQNIAITSTMNTYEFNVSVPSQWVGVATISRGMYFSTSNGCYIESVCILEETESQKLDYGVNGLFKFNKSGSKTIVPGTPLKIISIDCANLPSGRVISGIIKLNATELLSAAGYCNVIAQYDFLISKYAGSYAVVGTPTQLWKAAKSINSSTKSIDVSLTQAVSGTNLELTIAITAGGATPATSALALYELEVYSPVSSITVVKV